MVCAASVKKDIDDLLKSVPALDNMFSVIDKIGAGNLIAHRCHVFRMFSLLMSVVPCILSAIDVLYVEHIES